MAKQVTKQDCSGCIDNCYNSGTLAKECWSFSSAKLIKRKKIPNYQRPPWTQKGILYLSCYRQRGYIFIDGDKKC